MIRVNPDLVAHLVAIGMSLAVGGPIFAKGLRGRDPLVLLLGGAVVVDGMEWLFWLLAAFTPLAETAAADYLAVACRLGIDLSASLMLAFTYLVFRRGSRPALAAVGLLNAALLVGVVGSARAGDLPGYRGDLFWGWLEDAGRIGVYAWTAGESFARYSLLRRRIALGLIEPLVVDRFRLWGFYAAMFLVTQLGYVVGMFRGDESGALIVALAPLTIAGEIALWFAFFPPAWYARALARRLGPTP